MNKGNTTPVLILSAHTIALGLVRALGAQQIPVYLVSYDPKDMAFRSKYLKGYFQLPHPEHDEIGFVNGLLNIGGVIGKAIIFPGDDPTLVTLSKHVDELKPHFIIPTPDWSIVQKIISKDHTYALAEQIGIPIPKTKKLDINGELPLEILREFNFPFLLKPAQSHLYYEVFHRKMDIIQTEDEFKKQFDLCCKHGLEVVAQEIITGNVSQGLNFNSLFVDGKIRQGFTAYKVRMTEDGYGIPVVVRSREMIKPLWDYSEKLLSAMGYSGYSCIEYKFDASEQRYKLLEINGRYNRSALLSVKAGINFPLLEYNHILYGEDVVQQKYQTGVYYIDELKDLQVNFKKLVTGRQGLISFLKPYCSSHVNAVFSMHDLKPFLKRMHDGISILTKIPKLHVKPAR